MQTLAELAALVRAIAWGAGDILQSYYRGDPEAGALNIREKTDGPVTAADIAVNSYILDQLQTNLDNQIFGYLSEETYKTHQGNSGPSPLPHPWVWIIDPLDGTRDFIDRTGEYAIHIALVHQGRPKVAVVAWPETQKIYWAIQGQGTFVESRDGSIQQMRVSERKEAKDLPVVVSRTHRDQRFNQLLQKMPCQKQVAVGSVGCKVATILEHRADVYLALSGKSAPKDWDLAAPELILSEAGGQFTYFDGSPLFYNRGDVNHWGGLLASNGWCHQELCQEAGRILATLERD